MILEDMDSSVIGLGHDLIKNGVGIDCLPEDVIMKELRRTRIARSRPLNQGNHYYYTYLIEVLDNL